MDHARKAIQPQLAIGLLNELVYVPVNVSDVDEEMAFLISHARGIEDRLSAALRLVSPRMAVSLACGFSEHASECGTRQSQWQHERDRKNRDSTSIVRRWLNGDIEDSEIRAIAASWEFSRWNRAPVAVYAAMAAADLANAGAHAAHAAKAAKGHCSFHLGSRKARSEARARELDWQVIFVTNEISAVIAGAS